MGHGSVVVCSGGPRPRAGTVGGENTHGLTPKTISHIPLVCH